MLRSLVGRVRRIFETGIAIGTYHKKLRAFSTERPFWTCPSCSFKALLGTRADAIIAADRCGVIRFWNPGAERIFGHRAADAMGCSLDLIIPE